MDKAERIKYLNSNEINVSLYDEELLSNNQNTSYNISGNFPGVADPQVEILMEATGATRE